MTKPNNGGSMMLDWPWATKPTNEELKAAHAEGCLTGNDVCGALRHLGAGDSKWDWLSQEAAIMIETQAERLRERTTERDYHLRMADKLAERVRELEAQVEQLKAVIVSDTHVLLSKRPVAFRVRNTTDNAWVLFEQEDIANGFAELWGTQMQGLYARGGK